MGAYRRQTLLGLAWIFSRLPLISGQSFQYINNSSLPAVNLTDSCATALIQNISCDPWVSRFRSGQYYDPAGLKAVCTTDCQTAIQDYQSALAESCAGQLYNFTDSIYVPISTIAGQLLYGYNLVCLQDGGRFCNNVAYQASLQADPDAQAILGPAGSGNVSSCDSCFVKELKLEAESPFDGGSDLAADYSSLTESCSVTGMPLSTTTLSSSIVSMTSTSAATPTCMGDTYLVKPGDTCRSIAESQGISVGWLVADNSLNAYCADFQANGSLCITDTCKTYTVKQGDNCTTIASANNVTVAQVVSWNPIFNPSCTNIDYSVNDTICVGKPGRQYTTATTSLPVITSFSTAAAVPTDVASNTTQNCGLYYEVQPGDYCNLVCLKFGISLDDFLFLNPDVSANCTNLYAAESYCVQPVGSITDYPGNPGYIPPISSTPTSAYSSFPKATWVPPVLNITVLPFANGTRDDCYTYKDGDQMQYPNILNLGYLSACDFVGSYYEVTLEELQDWNPSLNTNSSDCAFDPAYQYCIIAYNSSDVPPPAPEPPVIPDPIRAGSWTNCSQYRDVDQGYDCASLLEDYCLTIAQFFLWNPEVGADCSNLWEDYSYCVGPTNDTSSTCGDNSTDPGSATTITASPSTPASSPTNTGSLPSVSPPAPTQPGIAANCDKYYVAISGDSCFSIENDNLLTDAQFHAWNPAISTDCSTGLWAGEAYCVGVVGDTPSRLSSTGAPPITSATAAPAPSPTQANSIVSNCDKYAISKSGDYCSIFASENSITAANLYAWNAVLGSGGANCDSQFWLGYFYCVGVSA